jgi:hypothetical protein
MKRKLTEQDKKILDDLINTINTNKLDTSDMSETAKIIVEGTEAMANVLLLNITLYNMGLIDWPEQAKPKPKPRNYYKQTSEFYCCKQKLKGVNVCGYHMDFECWEYKCPKCEKTFFIYDHNEYKGKSN